MVGQAPVNPGEWLAGCKENESRVMEGKISVHFKVKRHLQPHPIHPSDPCTCLYSYKGTDVMFFDFGP